MTDMVSTTLNVTRAANGIDDLITAIELIDDDKYAQTKIFNAKNRDVLALIASRTS